MKALDKHALFEALSKHEPSPGPCNNVGLGDTTEANPCGICALCDLRWEEEAMEAFADLAEQMQPEADDVERLRGYAAEDWTRLRQREADLITQVADLQNQLERKKPPLGYRHKAVCMFCDKQHGHYDECAEKFAELRNKQSG